MDEANSAEATTEEAVNDVAVDELVSVISKEHMPEPSALVMCENGIFLPAMFYYAVADADVFVIAAFHGFDLRVVTLEMDDGAIDLLEAHNRGEYVVDKWEPPSIPGWHWVGRVPTGDVPAALFITELEPASEEYEACDPVSA